MLRRITPDLHGQRVIGQLVGQIRVLLSEDDRDRTGLARACAVVLVPLARDIDEAGRADPNSALRGNLPALAAVEPGAAVVIEAAPATLNLEALAIVD